MESGRGGEEGMNSGVVSDNQMISSSKCLIAGLLFTYSPDETLNECMFLYYKLINTP